MVLFWGSERLCSLGTSLAFYRGQKGLSVQKKTELGFLGPLGFGVKEARKSRKRVDNEPNTRKKVKKLSFRLCLEFFRRRGREVPGTPFRTFFGVF